VEIYWGYGSQIYVTPIGPEEICVAVISRDSHLRLDQSLPLHPDLSARLQSAAVTTSERGAGVGYAQAGAGVSRPRHAGG
jgi:hypothetical protein